MFCLSKCIYHFHLGPLPGSPHIALTINTISRGGVKINVSCSMINLDFFSLASCLKMVLARLVDGVHSPVNRA